MTIDEALEEIGQVEECWIVWNSQTGEVLSVTRVAPDETPMDRFARLMALQEASVPVKARQFQSAAVTRQVLEQEVAQAARAKDYRTVLAEWSRATVGDLLGVLERGEFRETVSERSGLNIIKHLWDVHRDELTANARERLRALIGKGVLVDEGERDLRSYLAALDGDEAYLKAEWERDTSWRRSAAWELMDAIAHVQTKDQGVIDDLIGVVKTEGMFHPRYQAMMTLGKLGASASHAAPVIRAAIYDSQPYVTLTRDRVLERLQTDDQDWMRCRDCCYGRIHGKEYFGTLPCPTCLGMGYVCARRKADAD